MPLNALLEEAVSADLSLRDCEFVRTCPSPLVVVLVPVPVLVPDPIVFIFINMSYDLDLCFFDDVVDKNITECPILESSTSMENKLKNAVRSENKDSDACVAFITSLNESMTLRNSAMENVKEEVI